MQMQEIEQRAKTFAEARQDLATRLQDLRDEQESVKRRRLQGIRNALARFTAAHDELRTAVDGSREQFDKPKTRVLHGIRVGLIKQRGKLELGDPEKLVAAIRKLFPDQADALIKTTEKPVAGALQNLTAAELKRLGVRVTDDTDAVVIKPVDGDVDKLIDALINDGDVEEVR